MRSTAFPLCVVLALSALVLGDSNVHITDVGLHGYRGTPSAVRLVVRNPSSQGQSIHLKVAVNYGLASTLTVAGDVNLNGAEERQLELPVLIPGGEAKIVVDAFAGGSLLGHDTYVKSPLNGTVVVLMCANENVCQSVQSQIEFSGDIQERADKNRNLRFEEMNDPREDWWAYMPANAVVLATPLKTFSTEQRSALEGYLRRGGRLVLIEDEIADPDFLSQYREGSPLPEGERVAKGTLFRVPGLRTNLLGGVFSGRNVTTGVGYVDGNTAWQRAPEVSWLRERFASTFSFPNLSSVLIWLAIYVVVIGVVNFGVLRSMHRLEFGWITMCGLSLLFAAGIYFFSSSDRPTQFRLDNLEVYYLDSRSPIGAGDYELRISAPTRQDVVVSVNDPALFTAPLSIPGESTGQIWTAMNRQVADSTGTYEIRLGPPRQVQLSLLKWSFVDLNLEGLHQFSGTVHFVGPNRLRNDTGLHFSEVVYYDGRANLIYSVPGLDPGQEIQLDTIPRKSIARQGPQVWNPILDRRTASLEKLALGGFLPFAGQQQVFAGFSDSPVFPVDLNVEPQLNEHSLIMVSLEQ